MANRIRTPSEKPIYPLNTIHSEICFDLKRTIGFPVR